MPAVDWSDAVAVVIINPNSTAAMTDAMLVSARSVAPHLEFEGWTSHEGPPAIQGAEDGAAATSPMLRLVEQAGAEGADGILIGCFDDTGLSEAAALVSCPVLGIGQAAFHTCALRQWRFSVVTTLPVSVPVIEDNIARYGLSGLLGRVRASDIPVLDLEHAPETALVAIRREAEDAARDDGVNAIVLGCAGMVHVTAALRETLALPVVEPVETAAACMGWLGSMNSRRR